MKPHKALRIGKTLLTILGCVVLLLLFMRLSYNRGIRVGEDEMWKSLQFVESIRGPALNEIEVIVHDTARCGAKGHILALDVSIKNLGTEHLFANAGLTRLRDQEGIEHEPRYHPCSEPSLLFYDLYQGQVARGWVSFESPVSRNGCTLVFYPSIHHAVGVEVPL